MHKDVISDNSMKVEDGDTQEQCFYIEIKLALF